MTTHEQHVQSALAVCRGDFQRDIVLGNHTMGTGSWSGKMKRYSGSYNASVHSLLARLEQADIPYVIVMGPRGGWCNARLEIK